MRPQLDDRMDAPIKKRHANSFFINVIPTRDRERDMVTQKQLDRMPYALQKGDMGVISHKDGIVAARTDICRQLRTIFDGSLIEHDGTARVLWTDADLVIDDATPYTEIAEAIAYADDHDIDIVANYRVPAEDNMYWNTLRHYMPDTNPVLTKGYTEDEINALKPFQELPLTVAGMGWMYVRTPLDYIFHADGTSEDVWFCRDNDVKLHYWPLKLYHKKVGYV